MVAPKSNLSQGHQGPFATRGIHTPGPAATSPQISSEQDSDRSLTPRDAALLSTLISSNFNLAKTAADHGIASTELLAWLNSPRIQSAAATLLHASQTFLEIKLTCARMAVIDTLKEIALNHDSLTERRRAATALCRPMGVGAPIDRTGIRRIGNPPPFTVKSPGPSSDNGASAEVPSPNPHAHPRSPSAPAAAPSHHRCITPPKSPTPIHADPVRPESPSAEAQDARPGDSGLRSSPNANEIEGEAGSTVLPWPMPDSTEADPPSRLAQVLFHAFTNRDPPRLAATFFHHATEDATLDNRPLQEALPRHILAVMNHSREIAFVERSRSPNQATYTFSFERAPLIPSRASFRFLFTRPRDDTWLIHQIDTLDSS